MKKVSKILCIILLFFVSISVNASVITKDRNSLSNLGVNKKWTINSSNKSNVLNTPYVDASEKVYDFSEIILDSDEIKLKKEITEFIEITNMDMVIVTIDEPYFSDYEMEEFAADFYDYNDFGLNFDKYSGVLILRNSSSQNRYYNIYTFGEAQLYFSFERLERTLDNIYSDIYNDRYFEGFSTFIYNMKDYYNLGIPSEMKNYYVDEMGYLQEKYNPPIFLALVISGVLSAIVMYILISKNKMVKKAKAANEYLEKETINYTQRIDNFITSTTVRHVISSNSSGGGGRSSSRGSSGGGHSSGGGRRG